jgi:hypothetical protein
MLLRQRDELPPVTWQIQSVAKKVAIEDWDNRVILDLSWGNTRTGLGGLRATIDVGQTVTICGSVLEMFARTVGTGAGHADLRVMVSEGWKGNPLPVTYTDEAIVTDVAGIAQWWEIPPFATQCALLSDRIPDVTTALNVIMQWVASDPVFAPVTVAYQYNASWNQPFPGPIPLVVPSEARFLRVTYNTFAPAPVPGVRVQPIWYLSI